MVKHIVLYAFKEGVEKGESVKLIASVLEPLVGKIPGLLHLEIRQAFNGMDYALYSEFESQDALRAYAVHPLHLKLKHTLPICWLSVLRQTMRSNQKGE